MPSAKLIPVLIMALIAVVPSPAAAGTPAAGCGSDPGDLPGHTVTRTLTSAGLTRSYNLHVPAGYRGDTPTPLVFAFHGRTRTAEYQEQLTGMSALPAIVAYPQGTTGTDGEPSWQGAPYSSGADDVRFTSDLIDRLEQDLCVDPARVYVSGKSNGGGFAGLLACRLADRIAAAAPVSGAFYPQGGDCDPTRGVPIIDFHGGRDTTIPYAGEPAKGLPSIPRWLDAWAVRNSCGDAATVEPAPGVHHEVWSDCGSDLEHWKIDDLGHTWPSTTPNNDSATPTVLDATPLIWDFFQAHPLPVAPVARTTAGWIRGARDGAVDEFLGVRYAAAPVRWRAPQPVAPWRGVRDAATLGANCPQGTIGREDCLFLNVYRPAGAGGRLPVFVWIHGGGFTSGSGDDDAAALARTGHLMVVTINYRLGALGFLADPALGTHAGNYGLMDQQAALRWVRDNARALGGDPSRVTIGGESAGGGSVCAQLVSPSAAGLFRAAVIESDDCVHDVDSPSAARSRSAAITAAVGCAPSPSAGVPAAGVPAAGVSAAGVSAAGVSAAALAARAACLRAVPVADLVAKTGYIAPVIDGRLLPSLPRTAIAAGRWHRVHVLIGSNREEGRAFSTFATGYGAGDYARWLSEGPAWPPAPGTVTFGPEKAARIAAAYPLSGYPGTYPAAYAIGAVLTDSGTRGLGGCTQLSLARTLASQTRTFYYQFEDPHPPRLSSSPADFDYAAAHAYELPYLFTRMSDGAGWPYRLQMTAQQRDLSDRMLTAWSDFVTGTAPWPRFTSTGQRLLSLQPTPTITTGSQVSQQHHCALWNDILGTGPTP
ncbi:hypothetical protein GCM10010435_49820 [Winogradskya consettensis]|uniref:Carboxylesterase type B domain-containing protein n=1 Tax=Winogradskya consettensis TaxID=113560 RepID=A0A919VY59_9ACTN|nr:carboxylesterase family protein [Actinoplanes consettensis]GIM80067.1 hypothetical protein Aco04nite_68730 [Actinoplanes consettensis]